MNLSKAAPRATLDTLIIVTRGWLVVVFEAAKNRMKKQSRRNEDKTSLYLFILFASERLWNCIKRRMWWPRINVMNVKLEQKYPPTNTTCHLLSINHNVAPLALHPRSPPRSPSLAAANMKQLRPDTETGCNALCQMPFFLLCSSPLHPWIDGWRWSDKDKAERARHI